MEENVLGRLADALESSFPKLSFDMRISAGKTVIVKLYSSDGVNLANYETDDWNMIVPYFKQWLADNPRGIV